MDTSHLDSRQRGAAAAAGPVHLLLCANALYLQHVAVCLTSILANNPELFFDIVVVGREGEDLADETHARLRRSLARFGNHSLRLRAFTAPAECLPPLKPGGHYTLDTWTRLWVEDFFAPTVDRVLYLDSDIVVVGDIAPLWTADLGGALLGTVDIPGSPRGVTLLEMRPEDGYFNAGVLLIDLEQWRATRARDALLDYIKTFPDRLPDVDQDALNACFHARRARLDYKWNVIWPFYREPLALPMTREAIEAVRREARIVHFNGASKPWSYFCDHPRKPDYEKYLRMTEWRDFVPLDRTPLNRVRKCVSSVLPRNFKEYLKGLASHAAARHQAAREV